MSTQQVRNYEAAEILPPVPRSASGYRLYERTHLRALVTYRSLASGYGPVTARLMMQAVHSGDVSTGLGWIDAGHADLHKERRLLERVTGILAELVRDPPATSQTPGSEMTVGDVAAYLGVRASALRFWESAGLIAPGRDPATGHRRFDPGDVRDAEIVRLLRQGHHPVPGIREVLDEVRLTGDIDSLRSALDRRRTEISARSQKMLEGSSFLHDYLRSLESDD